MPACWWPRLKSELFAQGRGSLSHARSTARLCRSFRLPNRRNQNEIERRRVPKQLLEKNDVSTGKLRLHYGYHELHSLLSKLPVPVANSGKTMSHAAALEGGFLPKMTEEEQKRFTPTELLLWRHAKEYRYRQCPYTVYTCISLVPTQYIHNIYMYIHVYDMYIHVCTCICLVCTCICCANYMICSTCVFL